MIPGTYNYTEQYNGDTFEVTQWRFFSGTATGGNEIDLQGTTPSMKIRRDTPDGRVVKTLTIGDGLTWVDATLGELDMDEFLVDWGKGKYYYDLQVAFTATLIKTYVSGYIYVKDDVT